MKKEENQRTLKFGEIEHICPYCEKPIRHNVFKLTNKHECENCGTDLFVHLKNSYTLFTALLGFPFILAVMYGLGFRQTNFIVEILVLAVLAYLYSALINLLLCKIKGAQKVYVVDPIDPTILNRKPKKKR